MWQILGKKIRLNACASSLFTEQIAIVNDSQTFGICRQRL